MNKKRDDLEKQQKNICKDFFATLCEGFFAENEDVRSFEWNQYVPYFNDGDPCTFTTTVDYPLINGICKREDDDCDDGEGVYSLQGELLGYDSKERKRLEKAVRGFMSNFSEEDLERWFGEHVTVKVTRDGVETEEYEHD